MRSPSPRIVAAGVIVAVVVALGLQAVVGRPVFGVAMLPVLALPGIALAEALGASHRSWPERVLAGVVLVLVVSALAGLIAAISPRGLDAATVAAIEVVVLGVAALAQIWRRPRRPSAAPGVNRTPRRERPRSIRLDGRSVAVVVLGILLGAAGFAVASKSAQAQDVAEVVQFWAIPGSAGHTVLGIRNDTTIGLDCAITVTRPQHQPVGLAVGALTPSQEWLRELAPATTSETAPWQLGLACVASSGEHIQRTLTIAPPR